MPENKRTRQDLQMLQALPLEVKVAKTKQRIREWVNEWGLDGVYVSFSGGKDSTVLLHIAREMYPSIKAVHVNTGIEFPEIEKFVQTFDNVEIIKPSITFMEIVKKYGYPIISKEVSECVYGARRYLTQFLEQNENLAGRQAGMSINGWNLGIEDYADVASTRKLTGGGVREQVQKAQRNRVLHYRFERAKITGQIKYSKPSNHAEYTGGRAMEIRKTYGNLYY